MPDSVVVYSHKKYIKMRGRSLRQSCFDAGSPHQWPWHLQLSLRFPKTNSTILQSFCTSQTSQKHSTIIDARWSLEDLIKESEGRMVSQSQTFPLPSETTVQLPSPPVLSCFKPHSTAPHYQFLPLVEDVELARISKLAVVRRGDQAE